MEIPSQLTRKEKIDCVINMKVMARDHVPPPAITPPFPKKRYRCVVIDPPWPVSKIMRRVRPLQGKALDYPTLSTEEIMALPIQDLFDSAGCHVYLWVTQRYLPFGLKLFEHWNVKYQCLLTWIKPSGMTPFSWMYNTEHVLFGHVGNLRLLKLGFKLSFYASSLRHSEKPEYFYEIVRQVSPSPRLDMFARKTREGFEAWGNEIETR